MGGKHRPATPRDRALGAELQALRERAGLTLGAVANEIRWNISTLSRLERGLRHVSPEAVMGLSIIYELPTLQRNDLVARAKQPSALGWWNHPPPGVPHELGTLAAYEHDATRLTDWSPSTIPGLLQTRTYAETVMRDHGVPQKDLRPRLSAWQQRQDVLDRRHIDYTAFIGLAALHNHVCRTDEFLAQLEHLHKMADRDGITLRLVGTPTTLTAGGWYLMDFERSGSVAILENLGSLTFLFDHDTEPCIRAHAMLDALALPVAATQEIIKKLITRHAQAGGDESVRCCRPG